MGVPPKWLNLAPKPRALTGTDKWNVFLSYRSVNRTWVLNLYDVLRELGHDVFLDQVNLVGGDGLVSELQEALSCCQAGILIWSSASRDSEWVKREYSAMIEQADSKPGFHFVPVKIDNSKLPGFVGTRVFFDFSSYPDGPNGGDLLRLVHAIVGKPLSEEAARFANDQDEAAMIADARITAAIKNNRPDRLVQLAADGGLPWQTTAALGCKAAEGLTRLKCNDEAISLLTTLEERFPKAVRPKQLHALALARRGDAGDLDAAQDTLAELYARGERDPETLGIYARTWMDRYAESGDISHLAESRKYYALAFEGAKDDYYTGINAASKSVLLGGDENLARAAQIALQVEAIVGTVPEPDDYWKTATIAEILLIKKQWAEAGKMYEAAVEMARWEVGSHQSTWTQACRLMEKLQPSPEERALIRSPFRHLPDCPAA